MSYLNREAINCGKNDTMQGDCVENKVNVTVTWVEK